MSCGNLGGTAESRALPEPFFRVKAVWLQRSYRGRPQVNPLRASTGYVQDNCISFGQSTWHEVLRGPDDGSQMERSTGLSTDAHPERRLETGVQR